MKLLHNYIHGCERIFTLWKYFSHLLLIYTLCVQCYGSLLSSAVSPQFKLAIVAAGCCDVVVQALNAHHEDKCAATLGLEMISTLTGGPGLDESRSEHQHKLRKAGIFFDVL
jgi:hypothetical protein